MNFINITMIEILLFFGALLIMEVVAWFTHKYIMHGFLWVLHKDHHSLHDKQLERNDLFALIFAIPSFLLIFAGAENNWDYRIWLGAGIAAYGLCYFIFHDLLYHQRIKFFNQQSNRYFRVLVKAHGDHHSGKKNYGFLFMFPWRYFKTVR